jgi:hypothetical protein
MNTKTTFVMFGAIAAAAIMATSMLPTSAFAQPIAVVGVGGAGGAGGASASVAQSTGEDGEASATSTGGAGGAGGGGITVTVTLPEED